MIRLFYSNRTEELLDAFADEIRSDRAGADPFEPVRLVVPNRNIESYLKLGLACANGIAANLDVSRLERFAARLLVGDATSSADAPPVTVLDADGVRGLLLAILSDPERLAAPELAPVRRYLEGGGARADAVDRRRCQLSARLARIYEEYGYARADMLRAWPERLVLADTRYAAVEVWQRHLGLVVRCLRRRLVLVGGSCWMPLPELLAAASADSIQKVPRRVYVFGFSYMATAFLRFLSLLAQRTDVAFFTLNPCQEFWEDVETDRRAAYKKRLATRARARTLPLFGDASTPLENADDPPALRLWAKPGRETIQRLNDLTACNFEARFRDPIDGQRAPSLLHRLQHDILWREPLRTPRVNAYEGDRSITVLECASIRREAEVVAQEIWQLVRDGASFHEIAVVLNTVDRDAYLTHLTAAFDEFGRIPRRVVDVPLARQSRVVDAAGLLLGLPLGNFTRAEVLRVVTQPAVVSRFPDVDPASWVALADSLGIVHGADRRDHEGTYIAGDILNWDQGIRRIALGAFMTGRRSGNEEPFVAAEGVYLPEEVAPSAREGAAQFALLVRSLLTDARFVREARLPIAEWASFLRVYLTSYLVPAGSDDEQAIAQCVRAVAAIERFDVDGRAVSYRTAYELAREALAGLETERGHERADGVVISSFLPMRAIPFEAIFVVGLGEGCFPASDRPDPLDLRAAKRRAGDLTPRDQDRYMFLETILSTRERLYLSYVARDALTGETLAPSSVVLELLEMLERGYVGKGGAMALRRRTPLRRYDKASFPTLYRRDAEDTFGLPPEARREAQALALRESLTEAVGPVVSLDELRHKLSPAAWNAVTTKLALPRIPEAVERAAATETVHISITALRRFLECPLQGYARFRLGLEEEDDEDLLAREDEPFETPRIDTAMLLRELFVEHVVHASGTSEAAYAARTALRQMEGKMPTGVFAEAERGMHLDILEAWREHVVATCGGAARLLRHRFGRAEEHAKVDALHDPLVLELPPDPRLGARTVRVEIHGRTEPLSTSPRGSWLLALKPPAEPKRTKEALRAFLDHALLSATGISAGAPHTAFVSGAGPDRKLHVFRFAPFEQEEARAYLAGLAADLLSETHAYLLPCEAVFQARKSDEPIERIVSSLCNAYEVSGRRSAFSSVYGPIARPERYPPPPEERARAMIERRFGPFFAKQEGGA